MLQIPSTRKFATVLNPRTLGVLALAALVGAWAAMTFGPTSVKAGSPALGARAGAVTIASPAVDEKLTPAAGQEKAVFAGGCFWGVQAVFEHVKGVTQATAGYAGGSAIAAHYEIVSTGETGHAESVEVTYDPSKITYGEFLKVYFSVAHDPTELNRQGPDEGPQYRSSIFYNSDSQKKIAEAYIQQLDQAKAFHSPIVTKVVPLKGFYPAEGYHQDYFVHHPDDLYIVINDKPKVENLKAEFPNLYVNYP